MKIGLIDSQQLLWRSAQQFADLRTRSGQPTGVIFGALEKLITGLIATGCESLIATWDVGRSRWRKELHPGYKGSRKHNDKDDAPFKVEDVFLQAGQIQTLLMQSGVVQLGVQGVEADDLLGLVASAYRSLGNHQVVLLSSDKDLNQLVDGNFVQQYDPVNKLWHTVDQITEKNLGLGPERLIDLKSICGDAGDDIAGVKGIGPAGGLKLLETFGTFEALLDPANDDKIKALGKKYEKVIENRDVMRLARKLVTITTCDNHPQLLDEEMLAFQQQLWTPPVQNRHELVGSFEQYELEKTKAKLDHLLKPAPDLSGLENWFPRS